MTRSGSRGLSIKTNMVLKKGATFHSPTTPLESPEPVFTPPSLPRRSNTSLDDVIDAHRRRVALTLGDIDKTLASLSKDDSSASAARKTLRDEALPSRAVCSTTPSTPSWPRSSRPSAASSALALAALLSVPRVRQRSGHFDRLHQGEGGCRQEGEDGQDLGRHPLCCCSLVRRCEPDRAQPSRHQPHLRAHLKPLLGNAAFKDFHPLLLECPRKIQEKQVVCLRDLEKTLLLVAPVSELMADQSERGDTYRALLLKERTKAADLYLDFCLSTIRCIQATVEYLTDREQTRAARRSLQQRLFHRPCRPNTALRPAAR